MKITLSKTQIHDSKFLYDLASEKEVKESAFKQDHISYIEHCDWLHNKLNNSDCIMYVIYKPKNIPIGQIRFDLQEDNSYLVDISIKKAYRNKGFGKRALKMICNKIPFQGCKFIARIRPENLASERLFVSCGFYLEDTPKEYRTYVKNT